MVLAEEVSPELRAVWICLKKLVIFDAGLASLALPELELEASSPPSLAEDPLGT